TPPDPPSRLTAESLEALLDEVRDHPEWTDARRDEQFDLLVARFTPDALSAEVRRRLHALHGEDGTLTLRLIESLGLPDLGDALAGSLVAQPDLPPERAWHALTILVENDLLDAHPDLVDRFHELTEVIDESDVLERLVEQLEDEPDGSWVALHGLDAIEP